MKYPYSSRLTRRLTAVVLLAAVLLPQAASAQLLDNSANEDIDSIVVLVDEDIILRSRSAPAAKPCRRCTCWNRRSSSA